MAYLPPHKRHSTSTPSPVSLQSLSLSSPRRRPHLPSRKIIHAAGCVSRWSPHPPFSTLSASGSDSPLRLEPFPCEPIERKAGAKPLALVPSRRGPADPAEAAAAAIAGRFAPELAAAARRVRREEALGQDVRASLVARVGKVLFQNGGSPVSLDALREAAEAGDGSSSQVHRSFYTNIDSERLEEIAQSGVRMGLAFDYSKEHYHVKVHDKHQVDSTISCKCTVQEDGGLVIHKIELNQVRHLVEDISCLFKDLDLRLMLCTKRILKKLDVEVENAIKSLVSSAVIDPKVKGGLRWPLGKESIGERFSIVGVWHTSYKDFRNETLKLKLRHAERFDNRTSTEEVSNEVNLKLTGISQALRDGDPEANSLMEMLESAVRVIWDNLLDYKIVS